jgi:hypothetical protein
MRPPHGGLVLMLLLGAPKYNRLCEIAALVN